MDAEWSEDLERWLEPFLSGLGHKARRRRCPAYIAGLIGPGDRKSIQPMAARADEISYDRLHHFIGASMWDSAPLEAALWSHADDLVGGEKSCLIIDDTALPKKGKSSVGVAPQYASALGKNANCQTLVSATLASGEVPVMLSLRLFLPESWTSDEARMIKAGVPADHREPRTKPEIAIEEIDRIIAAGVRFGCVLADAGYGLSAPFRQALSARGLRWAVGIPTCLDVLSFGRPGTGSNVNRTLESCKSTFIQKSNKPTWMVDLEYKPIDDVMVYAKYARGYRAGGVKTDASGLETFSPEKVDSYELGLKSSFRGSVSGTFNLAGFYNDFTDQQLSAGAPYAGTFAGLSPAQIIVNAGKSRIWGIEAEGSITPVEGFVLQGSYAYRREHRQGRAALAVHTPDAGRRAGRAPWRQRQPARRFLIPHPLPNAAPPGAFPAPGGAVVSERASEAGRPGPGRGGVADEAVGLQMDGVPGVGVRQVADQQLHFVASVRRAQGQRRIDDVGGRNAIARIGGKIRLPRAAVAQHHARDPVPAAGQGKALFRRKVRLEAWGEGKARTGKIAGGRRNRRCRCSGRSWCRGRPGLP